MSRFKIIASLSLILLAGGEIYLNSRINKINLIKPETKIIEVLASPLPLPSPTSTPSISPIPSIKPITAPRVSQSVSFQPQIIYLGSASTTNTDWTTTGLEMQINSSDYPADVHANFEAGLSIINGEAWARLKNKTSGAIMSITEIYNNSNTITWKSSPSFQLHPGNNVYVVEIKSSSSELANLIGARIKIGR